MITAGAALQRTSLAALLVALVLLIGCSGPAAPTPGPAPAPETPPAQTPGPPAPNQPSAPCTFSVPEADRSRDVDAAGGVFTVPVATQAGCNWTASTSASFVALTPAAGTGNGNVQVTVQPNTAAARTAQVTIGAQTMDVRQAAASAPTPGCTFVVAPEHLTSPASGGTLNVDVSAGVSCEWTTTSSASFLVVASPASRTGEGKVAIQVAANPGRARTGSLTIAGKLVTVAQMASTSCVATMAATPTEYAASGGSGTLEIAAPAECDWELSASESFASVSGGATGSGSQTRDVVVAANGGTPGRTVQIVAGGKSVALSQAGTTGAPAPPSPLPHPLPDPGSPAVSRFTFTSSPGDYVGGGRSDSFSAAGATFSAPGLPAASYVEIVIGSGASEWRAHFAVPAGQALSTGVYENAVRVPFHGSSPGMSVSTYGRGCSQLSGRFAVHVLERAPSAVVTRFHATFVQFCEGASAPLTGEVVYVAPPSTPPAPTLPSSVSGFRYSSEPGDYVGAGGAGQFTASNATFSGLAEENGRVVHVTIEGANGDVWTTRFAAEAGRSLSPGMYVGAARSSLHTGTGPGIDVGGAGRGCNSTSGAFVVHTIEFGPQHTLQKLHVTFEQHCENATSALRGEVVAVLEGVTLPNPTPSPSSSLLRFVSQPGDYLGAGQTQHWTASSAAFAITDYPSHVDATVTPNGEPYPRWRLQFNFGGQLPAVGNYELIANTPSNTAPWFSMSGEGRGCNNGTTVFRVHDVVRQAGKTTRFQVTFETRCSVDKPPLRGEFVYIKP